MGKNIFYTIPQFFERRMNQHSTVREIHRCDDDEFIIYEIHRMNFGDTVRVFLSDQYTFTEHDLDAMRPRLAKNDYVLIARPEAGCTGAAKDSANETQLGIGKLGELMGALNCEKMWEYLTPEEKEELAKSRRQTRAS